MDRWSVFAVFVVMFGLLGMALPLFPPTNALLCRLACEPGQTYELVHQDTGIESTRSFACVNPDGGHRSLSGDNSPAETRAALVNIGTASVLAAIASWLLWRRFRRRPPTP